MKGYCIYCKQTQVVMQDNWVCVACSAELRGKT